jgi:hypothetical protein
MSNEELALDNGNNGADNLSYFCVGKTACRAQNKVLIDDKNLVRLTKLVTGREPEMKSATASATAKESDLGAALVIWQRIMSSPGKSAMTNARRRFTPVRSENGKGITTTSPFTNFPMPRLPPVYPNLSQELPRS